MAQKRNSARFGQGAIYTLAQKGTNEGSKKAEILIGKGSDMSSKDYGKRKCKKKTITDALICSMVDIAKKEGRKDIEQILWNTWHCNKKLITHEGRVYGKYCKNRHCTICQSNRKAEMINRYYPVLKHWTGAQFLTLTIKACPKQFLKNRLKKFIQGLERISMRKKQKEATVND